MTIKQCLTGSIMAALLFQSPLLWAEGQQNKKQITWILNDFPPFIMVDKKLPGEGFADAYLHYIVDRMPEYEHRFEVAGISRAVALMERGTPVCHPALLKSPDREKHGQFSQPIQFVLSHHVILRKADLPRFKPYLNTAGKIRLDKLLADADLKVSLTDIRTLGPQIDDFLNKAKGRKNVQMAGVNFESPFKQLTAGWIDYWIGYPVEHGWYRMKYQTAKNAEFAYFPIADIPDFIMGHVVCTKGPWG